MDAVLRVEVKGGEKRCRGVKAWSEGEKEVRKGVSFMELDGVF